MIKIIVTKNEQKINKIKVIGHAEVPKYGKNLICAAITGIATGGLNAIDHIKPHSCKLIVRKGLIVFIVRNNSCCLQIILQTIYYQFITIYQQYKKFIIVKEIMK